MLSCERYFRPRYYRYFSESPGMFPAAFSMTPVSDIKKVLDVNLFGMRESYPVDLKYMMGKDRMYYYLLRCRN